MPDGILARAEQALGGIAPERCSAIEIEKYQQWLRDGGPGDLVSALREARAEVERLRESVSTFIGHSAAASRTADRAIAERDAARAAAERAEVKLEEARAAVARVRALADEWAAPKVTVNGESIAIKPEQAANMLARRLRGDA